MAVFRSELSVPRELRIAPALDREFIPRRRELTASGAS